MTQADAARFAGIMTGLAELYGKDISDGAMALWFEALKKYAIETVSVAMSAHVSSPDNGQFFPKPADVIRMIAGTSKDAALLAWAKVDKAVRMVGPYRSVVFDDPLIHAAISDMGGWIALGEKHEKEWPFVAAEFQNRYQGYKSRPEAPGYNGKLIGLSEADNRLAGFEAAMPILIGDAARAKAVLEGATGKVLQITTASEAVMATLAPKQPRLMAAG